MTEQSLPLEGEGYTLVRRKDGALKLNIAHWSPEVVATLEELGVAHVEQVGAWGRENAVLSQLLPFKEQIRSFISGEKDLDGAELLSEFSNLDSLTLQRPADPIDFRRLKSLAVLRLWKGSTFGRAAEAPALRSLLLWSMGAKDVRMLDGIESLRELELRQMPGVKSLNGIEGLGIETLDLTYINRLESLEPIAGLGQLKRLEINGASKAKDADALAAATELCAIKFDNGPVLPSLDVCASWKELETFEFWGTAIGDGPCSVEPLANLSTLTELILSGRPKSLTNLTDIEALGALDGLRVLKLDRVPELSSLAWISSLRELREFSLWGSAIGDRDLSPLLTLPHLRRLSLNLSDRTKAGTKYSPPYEVLLKIVEERNELIENAEAS
jgi:hypothetical protein